VYRERLSRDSFSVFTSLLGWRGYYVRESDSKYGSRGSLAKTLFVKKGHLPTARGLILMDPVDKGVAIAGFRRVGCKMLS